MGYTRPVDAPITDDFQDHVDRDSSEPGVDYACAYGTPVRAVYSGTVTSIKHDNSSGMGRYVQYLLDDGKETRSIHLSEVWAWVGQRVTEGQHLGLSGASGYGNDYYYGPHLHQTLWPGRAWQSDTIDFELYVGEDEDMPLDANKDYAAFSTMLQRALSYDTRPLGNGPTQEYGPTVWERLDRLESDLGVKIDDIEVEELPPNRTPAWIASIGVALLGVSAAIAVGLIVLT